MFYGVQIFSAVPSTSELAACTINGGSDCQVNNEYSHHTRKCALFLRNDLYCVEWGVKLYSLTHYC